MFFKAISERLSAAAAAAAVAVAAAAPTRGRFPGKCFSLDLHPDKRGNALRFQIPNFLLELANLSLSVWKFSAVTTRYCYSPRIIARYSNIRFTS